jgi:archaemetzincin
LAAIPPEARRTNPAIGHEQLLTTHVLQKLLPPRRPINAVAVLGLTTSDLWPGEGWNFVFGQADLRNRVGIYSLFRYGDPAADADHFRLCLERTLKVAVHETGHMLGIQHCTAYECGMNGSNNLAELDRNLLGFCTECEQKVWWACRLDPRNRYKLLVKFAADNKLSEEEGLWKASLDKLDSR